MTSTSEPGKPRPERTTFAGIRASSAGYRALPREVRLGIQRGQLPEDPVHRGLASEWARGYRFVAPVQILISLVSAAVCFSSPLESGVRWSRIIGVACLLWGLASVWALVNARRVLRADRGLEAR